MLIYLQPEKKKNFFITTNFNQTKMNKIKNKSEKKDRGSFSLFSENKNLKSRNAELEKKNKELQHVSENSEEGFGAIGEIMDEMIEWERNAHTNTKCFYENLIKEMERRYAEKQKKINVIYRDCLIETEGWVWKYGKNK